MDEYAEVVAPADELLENQRHVASGSLGSGPFD
jgi:hypothetical protein